MNLVAILSNTKSTSNARFMPRLRRFIGANSGIFHIEIQDIAEIDEALRMFVRAQPAVIIINGGDGTIQATISAIVNQRPFGDRPPPLAVLPSGKTNMIAWDLGMRRKPEKELLRLYETVRAGRIGDYQILRPLVGVDLGTGQAPIYGMFFGAAGIISGIEYARTRVFPRRIPNGIAHVYAACVLVAGSLLMRADSPRSPVRTAPMRINLKGGGIIDGRFFIVMVTTLDRMLMGIRLKAPITPGLMKFSCIEHRPMAVLRALGAMLRGRFGAVATPGTHIRSADLIRIHSDEAVTLDGELYHAANGAPIVLRGHEGLPFVRLPA